MVWQSSRNFEMDTEHLETPEHNLIGLLKISEFSQSLAGGNDARAVY
jgi:hypothetical protein